MAWPGGVGGGWGGGGLSRGRRHVLSHPIRDCEGSSSWHQRLLARPCFGHFTVKVNARNSESRSNIPTHTHSWELFRPFNWQDWERDSVGGRGLVTCMSSDSDCVSMYAVLCKELEVIGNYIFTPSFFVSWVLIIFSASASFLFTSRGGTNGSSSITHTAVEAGRHTLLPNLLAAGRLLLLPLRDYKQKRHRAF